MFIKGGLLINSTYELHLYLLCSSSVAYYGHSSEDP